LAFTFGFAAPTVIGIGAFGSVEGTLYGTGVIVDNEFRFKSGSSRLFFLLFNGRPVALVPPAEGGPLAMTELFLCPSDDTQVCGDGVDVAVAIARYVSMIQASPYVARSACWARLNAMSNFLNE
jgi:hypothetical protein